MSNEETPTCRCLRLIISIKAEDTTAATVALLTDTDVDTDTDADIATDTRTDTDTETDTDTFGCFLAFQVLLPHSPATNVRSAKYLRVLTLRRTLTLPLAWALTPALIAVFIRAYSSSSS